MKKKTGGGKFDPLEPSTYFIAFSSLTEITHIHPWTLIALNDIASPNGKWNTKELHERLERPDSRLFLDSGVFWLTNEHVRKHPGMRMDDALALPPESIDGFDWLRENYVAMVKEYEDRLWGYVELDQGGAARKRETREGLEAEGVRPIPVYHPLNDGWDYFDELFETYDRVCFGNIVQANQRTRRELLATLWERRRRYPDVWVHVLGLTPNEVTTVYPASSCDSSSFMYAIRYSASSAPGAHAMGDSFGKFSHSYTYDRRVSPDAPGGRDRGAQFLATEAAFMQIGTRAQERDLKALFGEDALLPAPDPKEGVRT